MARSTRTPYVPPTPEELAAQAVQREEKRVAKLISPHAVNKLVAELVETYALDIKGLSRSWSGRVLDKIAIAKADQTDEASEDCDWTLEWDRGWTIGCTLYVRLGYSDTEKGPNYLIRTYHPSTEISWSSAGGSVAAALAKVKLYQQVVEFAALVQARLDEIRDIGVAHRLDAPVE